MQFQEEVELVKKALLKPLPGSSAQQLLAPALRKTTSELLLEKSSFRLSSVLMLLYPDESGRMTTIFIERPVSSSVHSG
jgi:hypothetical protein